MKQLMIFLVILHFSAFTYLFAGEEGNQPGKWIIHGVVKDQQNGEILTGATIYVTELKTGTVTDAYGNYSLTLPGGDYTLVYSFIGF